jgi:hypothetical protein
MQGGRDQGTRRDRSVRVCRCFCLCLRLCVYVYCDPISVSLCDVLTNRHLHTNNNPCIKTFVQALGKRKRSDVASTSNNTSDAVRMETEEPAPAACSSETKSRSKRSSINEPGITNNKSDTEPSEARTHDETAGKDSSCDTQKNSTKSKSAELESPHGGGHKRLSTKSPDGMGINHVHDGNISDKAHITTTPNMNGAAADAGPSTAGRDSVGDVASLNEEHVSVSRNDENMGGEMDKEISEMEMDCACDPGPTEHVVEDSQLDDEIVSWSLSRV